MDRLTSGYCSLPNPTTQQAFHVPPKRTYITPGQKLELDLTPAERKSILENLTLLPPEYEAMLKKVHSEQPVLLTLDDLEDFSGYVAAESNHTTNKKLRKFLDSAFEKMTALLDKFTNEKLLAKKTTKKALLAERQEAERQKAMSDQAAFLATWAAGVLQAAGKQGAKSRVLETFVPGKLERSVLVALEDVTPAVRKRLAAGGEDFTLSEVGGMLMAVAGELCVAPVPLQIGLLMTARSLMTAMQDWVGETIADGLAGIFGQEARSSKTAKKKPAKKTHPKSKTSTKPITIYQFKITLLGTNPKIWRRIQIPDCKLNNLHSHIQAVMGWENSHLHHFDIKGVRHGIPEHLDLEGDGGIIDSKKIRVSQLVPEDGKKIAFRYTYDFGDNWEHEVLFEGIMKPSPETTYPVCVEGERACPPENCGGPHGYEHLLEVLADPKHEEHRDLLEWVSEDFDPELFDARIATVRMVRGLRG